MDINDKNILSKIKHGDREVFRKLFETYYQRLTLYANSYVEDTSVSEDIVQDLFFHLWEKRTELAIFSSISSYLFRAVHNRSIQYLRHKRVTSDFNEKEQLKLKEVEILYNTSGDFTFSEIQLNEIESIVSKTYSSLPEKTKEIFRLSREDHRSYQKIADILKTNTKTVEYHISKTLKTLRMALKDYFFLLFCLLIAI
ncbi:hypothetical protein ES705_40799 [subsurface metagenome]